MLNGEGQQHQDRADEEGPVHRQRHDSAEVDGEQRPVVDRHQRRGGSGFVHDCAGSGLGRDVVGDRIGASGAGSISIEDVARRDRGAEREHRRPGDPVAPDRQRRDELAVAQPGRRAIDRRAARLVREQARDFRIGEGLDEAHQHRHDPDRDRPGCRPCRRCRRSRTDQGGHAAGDPECALPIDGALQYVFAVAVVCCATDRHSSFPPGSSRTQVASSHAAGSRRRPPICNCARSPDPV